MKHLKRTKIIIAALMCACLVASTTVWAFPDVDGSTAEGVAIATMQEEGFINGFEDGTFRPNATLTRAEFVTIINKMYCYYVEAENVFTDVKKSDWFYHDVLVAVQAGYIKGMGDGRFAPNEPVTREQVCVMLNSILDMGAPYYTPTITDPVSDWAKESVKSLVGNFLFTLEDGGKFRATQPITRAEACVALEKCIVDVDFEDVYVPVDLESIAQEELEKRLSEIIKCMEETIIPTYTDKDAITVGKMVVESMKKYLDDPDYDYVSDANATYEIYRTLGPERAAVFKGAIYDNIEIENIAILFEFFYSPDLNMVD